MVRLIPMQKVQQIWLFNDIVFSLSCPKVTKSKTYLLMIEKIAKDASLSTTQLFKKKLCKR